MALAGLALASLALSASAAHVADGAPNASGGRRLAALWWISFTSSVRVGQEIPASWTSWGFTAADELMISLIYENAELSPEPVLLQRMAAGIPGDALSATVTIADPLKWEAVPRCWTVADSCGSSFFMQVCGQDPDDNSTTVCAESSSFSVLPQAALAWYSDVRGPLRTGSSVAVALNATGLTSFDTIFVSLTFFSADAASEADAVELAYLAVAWGDDLRVDVEVPIAFIWATIPDCFRNSTCGEAFALRACTADDLCAFSPRFEIIGTSGGSSGSGSGSGSGNSTDSGSGNDDDWWWDWLNNGGSDGDNGTYTGGDKDDNDDNDDDIRWWEWLNGTGGNATSNSTAGVCVRAPVNVPPAADTSISCYSGYGMWTYPVAGEYTRARYCATVLVSCAPESVFASYPSCVELMGKNDSNAPWAQPTDAPAPPLRRAEEGDDWPQGDPLPIPGPMPMPVQPLGEPFAPPPPPTAVFYTPLQSMQDVLGFAAMYPAGGLLGLLVCTTDDCNGPASAWEVEACPEDPWDGGDGGSGEWGAGSDLQCIPLPASPSPFAYATIYVPPPAPVNVTCYSGYGDMLWPVPAGMGFESRYCGVVVVSCAPESAFASYGACDESPGAPFATFFSPMGSEMEVRGMAAASGVLDLYVCTTDYCNNRTAAAVAPSCHGSGGEDGSGDPPPYGAYYAFPCISSKEELPSWDAPAGTRCYEATILLAEGASTGGFGGFTTLPTTALDAPGFCVSYTVDTANGPARVYTSFTSADIAAMTEEEVREIGMWDIAVCAYDECNSPSVASGCIRADPGGDGGGKAWTQPCVQSVSQIPSNPAPAGTPCAEGVGPFGTISYAPLTAAGYCVSYSVPEMGNARVYSSLTATDLSTVPMDLLLSMFPSLLMCAGDNCNDPEVAGGCVRAVEDDGHLDVWGDDDAFGPAPGAYRCVNSAAEFPAPATSDLRCYFGAGPTTVQSPVATEGARYCAAYTVSCTSSVPELADFPYCAGQRSSVRVYSPIEADSINEAFSLPPGTITDIVVCTTSGCNSPAAAGACAIEGAAGGGSGGSGGSGSEGGQGDVTKGMIPGSNLRCFATNATAATCSAPRSTLNSGYCAHVLRPDGRVAWGAVGADGSLSPALAASVAVGGTIELCNTNLCNAGPRESLCAPVGSSVTTVSVAYAITGVDKAAVRTPAGVSALQRSLQAAMPASTGASVRIRRIVDADTGAVLYNNPAVAARRLLAAAAAAVAVPLRGASLRSAQVEAPAAAAAAPLQPGPRRLIPALAPLLDAREHAREAFLFAQRIRVQARDFAAHPPQAAHISAAAPAAALSAQAPAAGAPTRPASPPTRPANPPSRPAAPATAPPPPRPRSLAAIGAIRVESELVFQHPSLAAAAQTAVAASGAVMLTTLRADPAVGSAFSGATVRTNVMGVVTNTAAKPPSGSGSGGMAGGAVGGTIVGVLAGVGVAIFVAIRLRKARGIGGKRGARPITSMRPGRSAASNGSSVDTSKEDPVPPTPPGNPDGPAPAPTAPVHPGAAPGPAFYASGLPPVAFYPVAPGAAGGAPGVAAYPAGYGVVYAYPGGQLGYPGLPVVAGGAGSAPATAVAFPPMALPYPAAGPTAYHGPAPGAGGSAAPAVAVAIGLAGASGQQTFTVTQRVIGQVSVQGHVGSSV